MKTGHAFLDARLMRLAFASVLLAALTAISPVRSEDGYQTADGLAVYLGIMPAAMLRGHPGNHEEGAMHGGPGSGRHQQHIVVAVFDADSGDRVEDASVALTVSGLGHVGHRRIALEPMVIAGTVTYGEFIDFPGSDRYEIAVEVSVPGRQGPTSFTFSSEHLR